MLSAIVFTILDLYPQISCLAKPEIAILNSGYMDNFTLTKWLS